MINKNLIISHYEKNWGTKRESRRWDHGPTGQLPPDFQVILFSPSKQREMWTYATCGMSQQSGATPIELHLHSPIQADGHIELLTAVAHYHLTRDYIDVGHTVNFGRPWLPKSICDHGLISLPFLDGPPLEWLDANGAQVRFLWLIPIRRGKLSSKSYMDWKLLNNDLKSQISII